MGSMTAHSFVEEAGKVDGLRMHLQSNFYPPHPQYVVDSTIEGFERYWAGESSLELLAEDCYLKDVDGLYRYYDAFLEEYDDE